jgi:hypothetical protein
MTWRDCENVFCALCVCDRVPGRPLQRVLLARNSTHDDTDKRYATVQRTFVAADAQRVLFALVLASSVLGARDALLTATKRLATVWGDAEFVNTGGEIQQVQKCSFKCFVALSLSSEHLRYVRCLKQVLAASRRFVAR